MAAVERKEQVHIRNLPLEEERVRRRKVRKVKKKRNKAKEKLKLIAVMAMAMSIAFLLLYRYSEISKMKYDIVGLESSIGEANQVKKELNIELGEIVDSDWLVAEAQGRVNLRKAEEGQFVTVNVSEASVGEVKSQTSGADSLFAGIKGVLFK